MPPNDHERRARGTAKPLALVTIEATLPQLIGAFMQRRSFFEAHAAADYFLCIVSDSAERADELADVAGELGIACAVSIGRSTNPYLNKWRVLDHLGAPASSRRESARQDTGAYSQPRVGRVAPRAPSLILPESGARGATRPTAVEDDQPVLLLDWDVLNTAGEKTPLITTTIGARHNPANLYVEIISASPAARALAGSRSELRTSINGGVLASTPALLRRCADRTEFIITALREDGVTAPDWQVEQFALSVAVGEIGFTPLDDRWNVTPVSPVDDRDVAFWHYNDSIEPTRRLKQSLDCPVSVAELLLELDERWPRQTEVFRRLYSEALASKPLQRAIERQSAAPAVVC